MIKKIICLWLCCLGINIAIGQDNNARIQHLRNSLEILAADNDGFNQNVKSEVSLNKVTLGSFLLGLAELHHLNINVAPELNQITLVNNFTNVTVTDLLIYLCKEYELDIDFTGNILMIKKIIHKEDPPAPKVVSVSYNKAQNTISLDVKHDLLYDVLRKIMDVSGKNLFFSSELEKYPLTSYMVQMPFDAAMQKLAFENNLTLQKNHEGFYIFEKIPDLNANSQNPQVSSAPVKHRMGNFYFKVLDKDLKVLDVDFTNTPIASIVYDIGNELGINMFIASPLEAAGTATFKATHITFDDLLSKIFEAHKATGKESNASAIRNSTPNNTTELFTFKNDGNIYYFGTSEQLTVRNIEVIQLNHRSIQMLADPSGTITSTNASGNGNFNSNNNTSYSNNNYNRNTGGYTTNNNYNTTNNLANRTTTSVSNQQELKDISSIIPEDLLEDLIIKTDYELNRFYVSGPSKSIERFRNFIEQIDKPVPVVLIEVMIIEVSKTTSVDTGISWGIGENPVTTTGELYPEANITLGAATINKVIGGFDGFGSYNLGKVVPNFYMTLSAMESNGNIKIHTTPKLATLNGHMATFSNGNSTYYAITDRYVYGNDNPQTSVVTNYQQIDVGLGLYIKPYVSGDGQVTLDMKVVQSDFGERIAEEAPPNITSKEFSSIIRVHDQDIVVLGGLEMKSKNDTGSGVPLLARIPVIKWLFSRRVRTDAKSKLSVLIKPTVIN